MAGRDIVISNAARRVLEKLKEAEDADELFDAEIVCEGRVCYVGLDTIAKRTVNELLRLVLISDNATVEKAIERYSLNEEGRAILEDPNYVPKIVPIMSNRA